MPRVLVLLALLSLAACEGPGGAAGASAPLDGYWVGDRLNFQVRDGVMTAIQPKSVSCQRVKQTEPYLRKCFETFSEVVAGDIPIEDFAAAGKAGPLDISAAFTSETDAKGTWKYASDCCSTEAAFEAHFVAPMALDAAAPDAASEDAPAGSDAATGIDSVPGVDAPPGPDGLGGTYPGSADEEQVAAFDLVNQLRAKAKSLPVDENEKVNNAAQAHANYYVFHYADYMASGLSPHEENAQWKEGFTGQNFWERMVFAGYTGAPGYEIMAFSGSTPEAIQGWLETLYHRIPLLHPDMVDMGYGYNFGPNVQVIDCGSSPAPDKGIVVVYPYDGQTGVRPIWEGWESPQPPLPAGQKYPSGPIITLMAPGAAGVQITTTSLKGPGGEAVPHQFQHPGIDSFLVATWGIYSYDPLKAKTKYTVTMSGKRMGEAYSKTWSFTTGN